MTEPTQADRACSRTEPHEPHQWRGWADDADNLRLDLLSCPGIPALAVERASYVRLMSHQDLDDRRELAAHIRARLQKHTDQLAARYDADDHVSQCRNTDAHSAHEWADQLDDIWQCSGVPASAPTLLPPAPTAGSKCPHCGGDPDVHWQAGGGHGPYCPTNPKQMLQPLLAPPFLEMIRPDTDPLQLITWTPDGALHLQGLDEAVAAAVAKALPPAPSPEWMKDWEKLQQQISRLSRSPAGPGVGAPRSIAVAQVVAAAQRWYYDDPTSPDLTETDDALGYLVELAKAVHILGREPVWITRESEIHADGAHTATCGCESVDLTALARRAYVAFAEAMQSQAIGFPGPVGWEALTDRVRKAWIAAAQAVADAHNGGYVREDQIEMLRADFAAATQEAADRQAELDLVAADRDKLQAHLVKLLAEGQRLRGVAAGYASEIESLKAALEPMTIQLAEASGDHLNLTAAGNQVAARLTGEMLSWHARGCGYGPLTGTEGLDTLTNCRRINTRCAEAAELVAAWREAAGDE